MKKHVQYTHMRLFTVAKQSDPSEVATRGHWPLSHACLVFCELILTV